MGRPRRPGLGLEIGPINKWVGLELSGRMSEVWPANIYLSLVECEFFKKKI